MLTKALSHSASRSLASLSHVCSLYPQVSPSSSLTIASFLPHPHAPSQLPQHPHPLCYWFLVNLFVIWLCSSVLPPPLPCFISLYLALPPPTFLTCLYLSLASNAPFWSVFSKSWWHGLTMATCAFTETQKINLVEYREVSLRWTQRATFSKPWLKNHWLEDFINTDSQNFCSHYSLLLSEWTWSLHSRSNPKFGAQIGRVGLWHTDPLKCPVPHLMLRQILFIAVILQCD